MEITVQTICRDLPGVVFECVEDGTTVVRTGICLGIQRGDETVDAVPADRRDVVFEAHFPVAPRGDGVNFLGPYAKGTPDKRFFYLVWTAEGDGGKRQMFRRAKIHLSHLDWSVVERAARRGQAITAEVAMTDRDGGPRCGTIPTKDVRWTV